MNSVELLLWGAEILLALLVILGFVSVVGIIRLHRDLIWHEKTQANRSARQDDLVSKLIELSVNQQKILEKLRQGSKPGDSLSLKREIDHKGNSHRGKDRDRSRERTINGFKVVEEPPVRS